MEVFLSCYLQLLLSICLPPIVFGLAAWLLYRVYCLLVGGDEGRPLLMATAVLSTPLRELGHLMACMLSLHRVEDACLLDLRDPNGEWGFVEHSYNPRNPIAILGNFLYALGPVVTGLFAVFVICSTCFYGVLPTLFEEVGSLALTKGGIGVYAKVAFSLIPRLFTAGEAPVVLRILGFALLLGICSGIHVSLGELKDAVGGALILAVLLLPAVGVLRLLDGRVLRITVDGTFNYAVGVVSLFTPVLLALAALVAVGFVFRLICTLFSRGDAGGAV